MHYLKKIFFIILISTNYPAFCQVEENSFYASVVVIEDSDLINAINTLIVDNKCINKRADLYLDYRKNDYFILGQGSIRQYTRLFKKEDVKVYMTFLNNNPLFIFSNDDKNLPIRKTEFKIDLSDFLEVYDYSIRDLSYWILKEEGGETKVIKEVLFGCD